MKVPKFLCLLAALAACFCLLAAPSMAMPPINTFKVSHAAWGHSGQAVFNNGGTVLAINGNATAWDARYRVGSTRLKTSALGANGNFVFSGGHGLILQESSHVNWMDLKQSGGGWCCFPTTSFGALSTVAAKQLVVNEGTTLAVNGGLALQQMKFKEGPTRVNVNLNLGSGVLNGAFVVGDAVVFQSGTALTTVKGKFGGYHMHN